MLVLSRRPTQSIQIGDNIVVMILGVRGNTVKVGIEAPSEVRILRSELQGNTPELPADFIPATVVPTGIPRATLQPGKSHA